MHTHLLYVVTETEVINLLLGNNNCTCVDVERPGGLSFVISNPDPDELDIVCRIHGTGCYSPVTCNSFNDSGLIPFFQLCDNPPENSHILCFGNISKQLNGSRFELFALKAARCPSTPQYAAREYFKSFEFSGKLYGDLAVLLIFHISISYSCKSICKRLSESYFKRGLLHIV